MFKISRVTNKKIKMVPIRFSTKIITKCCFVKKKKMLSRAQPKCPLYHSNIGTSSIVTSYKVNGPVFKKECWISRVPMTLLIRAEQTFLSQLF